MPLSEHEQRLLEEMERNLYKNEADVVSTTGFTATPNYRAITVGVLVGLGGLVTMVAGVSFDLALVGILGFGILFSGVMVAVATPGKKSEATRSPSSSARPSARASSSSFMDRLNERWERRERGETL